MVITPRVEGKSQGDGAFVIEMGNAAQTANFHQIKASYSATPSAGTLAIEGQAIGENSFDALGTIDLVSGPLIYTFNGHYDYLQVTPTSFDGGKTYNINLISSNEAKVKA